MKIFVVSRANPISTKSALGIFEFDQAKALASLGHDVSFISIDLRSVRRKREFGFDFFNDSDVKIYNYSFPMGKVPNFLSRALGYFFYKKMLKKVIKEQGRPDFIHAHFALNQGWYVYKNKLKTNIPYVISEHASRLLSGNVKKDEKRVLKKIYSDSIVNISVSSSFKEKLEGEYGAEFAVVDNIVDTSSFQFIKDKNKNDVFNFVSTGNLIKRKGFDVLIKAFSLLYKDNKNVRLTIIGGGEEKENLSSLIKSLGLEEIVCLIGEKTRNEINNYFQNSDAFILTSKAETFGVVYIEAMFTGLPVIATKCGGPESFIDRKCGLFANVDDVDDIASAMKDIIKNASSYNREEIHNYVLNRFSPEVIANKIIDLVNEKLK